MCPAGQLPQRWPPISVLRGAAACLLLQRAVVAIMAARKSGLGACLQSTPCHMLLIHTSCVMEAALICSPICTPSLPAVLQPHLFERAGGQDVFHCSPAGHAVRQVGQLCWVHCSAGGHDGELAWGAAYCSWRRAGQAGQCWGPYAMQRVGRQHLLKLAFPICCFPRVEPCLSICRCWARWSSMTVVGGL